MSEIPEIERLRAVKGGPGESWNVDAVALEDAERELRSALDRQAREIVEALEEAEAMYGGSVPYPSGLIAARFAPKEADPRCAYCGVARPSEPTAPCLNCGKVV